MQDVLRPRLALNIDDDTAHWSLKVDGDEGAEVSLGVLVRVEEAGETLRGIILDWANVLDVSRVLALARHPNRVEAVAGGRLFVLHKVLQSQRHLVGQTVRLIVVLRDPAVDLVQLEEDTGRTLVIVVVVLLDARRPALDVHVAHLSLWRWLLVVAVVDVLATARGQSRNAVN